jgi:bloom syndrome protein
MEKMSRNEVPEDDQDDDEVLDPNHRNVIDLCDSDVEEGPAGFESVSNYSYSDDGEDYDDDDEVQTSHHFNQQQDPEVAAFNDRMSQLGTAVPKAASTSRASRGGSKALGSKKGRTYRKSGSGSSGGKLYAGVKKRATKGSGSRASGGAAKKTPGGNRRGGASGGGWSAIMAMPT